MRTCIFRILCLLVVFSASFQGQAQTPGEYVLDMRFTKLYNGLNSMDVIKYTVFLPSSSSIAYYSYEQRNVKEKRHWGPGSIPPLTFSVNKKIDKMKITSIRKYGSGKSREGTAYYTFDYNKSHTDIVLIKGNNANNVWGESFVVGCDADLNVKLYPKRLQLWYFDSEGKESTTQQVLPEKDRITLKTNTGFSSSTYRWQYSTDGTNWVNLPGSVTYNAQKDAVTFSASDLFTPARFDELVGSNIHFRINTSTYDGTTTILTLNMRYSAPRIKSITYDQETCYDNRDAKVYITLDRALYPNEMLNIRRNGEIRESDGGSTPLDNTNTATLSYLQAGTYTFSIETYVKKGSQEFFSYTTSGSLYSQNVTIAGRPAINHRITGARNVGCFGGNDGSIGVEADGGTGSMTAKLYKNGESLPLMEKSFLGGAGASFDGLEAGSYQVKTFDSNNCVAIDALSAVISQPQKPVLVELEEKNIPLAHNSADGSVVIRVSGGGTQAALPEYTMSFTSASGQSYTADSSWPDGEDMLYRYEGLARDNYTVVATSSGICSSTLYFYLDAHPPLLVTIQETGSIQWSGGSQGELTAHGQGGSAASSGLPYQYEWYRNGQLLSIPNDHVARNLVAGNYQVKITDQNGISAFSATYTLTEPAPVNAQATPRNVNCFGGGDGTITIRATGGTRQYTAKLYRNSDSEEVGEKSFTSSTVFDRLEEGDYSLKVTDTSGVPVGQVILPSVVISQPPEPVFIALDEKNLPLAHDSADGSVVIRVSGGTKTASGRYTLLFTSVSGQSYQAASSSVDGDDVLYRYNGLARNDYTVVVRDNNYASLAPAEQNNPNACSSVLYFNMDAHPPLTVWIEATQGIRWPGGDQGELTAHAEGGLPNSSELPYQYEWYRDGILLSMPNDSVARNLTAGNYWVKVIDQNGIFRFSTAYTLEDPDAIVIQYTSSDANCYGGHDGSISAVAAGGAGEYIARLYRDGTSSVLIEKQFYAEEMLTIDRVSAGNYRLEITDIHGVLPYDTEGNVIAPVLTIGQPSSPVSVELEQTVSPLAHNSADGSVVIRIEGGVTEFSDEYTVVFTSASGQDYMPVSFSWQGDYMLYYYDGLPGGDYTVAAYDDNYDIIPSEDQINPYGCATTLYFHLEAPPPLLVSIEETQFIRWYGGDQGELTAYGQGGVPASEGAPYRYEWFRNGELLAGADDNVIERLTIGEYQVRITDQNGITASAIYTLTQPDSLSIRFVTTDVGCYGNSSGAIETFVQGGVPPYTYQWNIEDETGNVVSNIGRGIYMLKVIDAYGGQKTGTAEIKSSKLLVVDAQVTQPTCLAPLGGVIEVTLNEGTPPYRVQWDDSPVTDLVRTDLAPGTYRVTITDSSDCVNETVFNLYPLHSFTVDLGSDIVMCHGQSRPVYAVCEEPDVTYEWYLNDKQLLNQEDFVVVDQEGTYRVKAINPDGCFAVDEIQIRITTEVLDLELVVPTRVEIGTEIHAVNLTQMEADRYEWTLPEAARIISTSDIEAVFVMEQKGSYSVTLEGFKGEGTSMLTRNFSVVGKGEVELPGEGDSLIKQFLVTPSPSTGYFKVLVELNSPTDFEMALYSPAGVLMDMKEESGVQQKVFEYEINGTLQGTYSLRLQTATDQSVLPIEIKR